MSVSVPAASSGGNLLKPVDSRPRTKRVINEELTRITENLGILRGQLAAENGKMTPVQFNALVKAIQEKAQSQDALLGELWEVCCWEDPAKLGESAEWLQSVITEIKGQTLSV